MNKKKTEAADSKMAKAAKKKREAVAITVSLIGSKKPEELCQSNIIKDLVEIAFDITSWEDSNASTIDIECLKENCPQFGVLDERNGRKIYAFFDSHQGQEHPIIKKLVVPLYNGSFFNKFIAFPWWREGCSIDWKTFYFNPCSSQEDDKVTQKMANS